MKENPHSHPGYLCSKINTSALLVNYRQQLITIQE